MLPDALCAVSTSEYAMPPRRTNYELEGFAHELFVCEVRPQNSPACGGMDFLSALRKQGLQGLHCGLYFSLVKLYDTFECGTSIEQVGRSICEAVAKADPSYNGRYRTSVISDIPVNRCGYTLVYVYCYCQSSGILTQQAD